MVIANINIQTYKKGPDYIDMGWLSAASRNNCYNLDFNTQTKDEILNYKKNAWIKDENRIVGDLLFIKKEERLKMPDKKNTENTEPLSSYVPTKSLPTQGIEDALTKSLRKEI